MRSILLRRPHFPTVPLSIVAAISNVGLCDNYTTLLAARPRSIPRLCPSHTSGYLLHASVQNNARRGYQMNRQPQTTVSANSLHLPPSTRILEATTTTYPRASKSGKRNLLVAK